MAENRTWKANGKVYTLTVTPHDPQFAFLVKAGNVPFSRTNNYADAYRDFNEAIRIHA